MSIYDVFFRTLSSHDAAAFESPLSYRASMRSPPFAFTACRLSAWAYPSRPQPMMAIFLPLIRCRSASQSSRARMAVTLASAAAGCRLLCPRCSAIFYRVETSPVDPAANGHHWPRGRMSLRKEMTGTTMNSA
jgi:hypothetical protein